MVVKMYAHSELKISIRQSLIGERVHYRCPLCKNEVLCDRTVITWHARDKHNVGMSAFEAAVRAQTDNEHQKVFQIFDMLCSCG